MHANPAYKDRMEARVVEYPDGGKVLQYWSFYYNNPKTYATRGNHEGDWEMAQVHPNPSQEPVAATYSQHGWGERCDWIHAQRNSLGQPIVYVAEGSHASYFNSGYHFNENPGGIGAADDTANGDGERVGGATLIDITSPPDWLKWPGHWGGTPEATLTDGSPVGPLQQGGNKWNDPVAWSHDVKGCTGGQTQNPRPSRAVVAGHGRRQLLRDPSRVSA
jgi:hypothetical protein